VKLHKIALLLLWPWLRALLRNLSRRYTCPRPTGCTAAAALEFFVVAPMLGDRAHKPARRHAALAALASASHINLRLCNSAVVPQRQLVTKRFICGAEHLCLQPSLCLFVPEVRQGMAWPAPLPLFC